MTINEIVGTVLLRVSGGVPTSDVSVRRWDIVSVIPAAVNYAITQDYWANLKNEGDRDIPGSFVTELEDKSIMSDSKGRDYIELSEKIINVGVSRGIRYVRDNCGNNYSPLGDSVSPSDISCYYGKALPNEGFYQRQKGKLLIYNKPSLVESLNIGVILDVSELDHNEELPIPAGYEPHVLDILVAFFKDQRFTPKDYIVDGRDLFGGNN